MIRFVSPDAYKTDTEPLTCYFTVILVSVLLASGLRGLRGVKYLVEGKFSLTRSENWKVKWFGEKGPTVLTPLSPDSCSSNYFQDDW